VHSNQLLSNSIRFGYWRQPRTILRRTTPYGRLLYDYAHLLSTVVILFKDRYKFQYWLSRGFDIVISLAAHVLFFATRAGESLLFVSQELHFRFQSDKYSALVDIVCGALMKSISNYMAWAYGSEGKNRTIVCWGQRMIGLTLIIAWYKNYENIPKKETYNPFHPYIFVLPLIGFLMIRNSSRYLTECTLRFWIFLDETCWKHMYYSSICLWITVYSIYSSWFQVEAVISAKVLNMFLCGTLFVMVAIWARKVTVTTQTTVVDLMKTLKARKSNGEREVIAKM